MRGKTVFASLVTALAVVTTLGFGSAQAIAATTTDHAVIKIHHFNYQGDLVVAPGQKVTVINLDGKRLGIPHSLTSNDGLFDTGVFVVGHRNFFAPAAPGEYRFHCVVHDTMKGTLFVIG
ncbi:MAG: cupredoxin domain-containing protein [Actinomycetota bacterium]|nr:cupredoxin domain-containing protein [Actinomycetota bacterium]